MGAAYDKVVESLTYAGSKIKHNGNDRCRAQCPAHGGEDLNLAVAVGDQGVLLKCQSYGCTAEEVAAAIGLELSDLFDDQRGATYDYGGGHRVFRTRTTGDKKAIRQEHKPPITSLYRPAESQRIEDAEVVMIVEGEKCADAAIRLGAPCVTAWPGGSSAVSQVDISPLAGKRIRLIADNDKPGHTAMAKMYCRLQGFATVESIYTARGEGEGIDDVWTSGGTVKDLVPLDLDEEIAKWSTPTPEREVVIDYLKDRRSKVMEWLWEGVVPLGAASVFAGMGGVSKSTFSLWLAGRVTKGTLDGQLHGIPSTALYISHEDEVERTTMPRAQVNGINLQDGLFGTLTIKLRERKGATMPRFPEDLEIIEKAIVDSGARLIVIDPILSTMESDKNMNDARHVRELIDPLNEMAQRLNVAIVCIAHLNKSTTGARTSIPGSGAWVDATRSTMVFAMEETEDDQPQQVVLSNAKANYTRTGGSFTYRILEEMHLHDDGNVKGVPKIQWLGTTKRTVDDIMSEKSDERRLGSLSQELKAFIESAPGATSTESIYKQFPDQKQATIRSTLHRLATTDRIDSPAYGYYQSVRLRPAEAS